MRRTIQQLVTHPSDDDIILHSLAPPGWGHGTSVCDYAPALRTYYNLFAGPTFFTSYSLLKSTKTGSYLTFLNITAHLLF